MLPNIDKLVRWLKCNYSMTGYAFLLISLGSMEGFNAQYSE